MKRRIPAAAFLAFCLLAIVPVAHAQMGMDIFKRPSITKAFHPVVGKGAAYQSTGKDSGTRSSEIGIVGKDSADGKDGFWMEFVSAANDGKQVVGKVLITIDDFQFHRMIFQQPGQQAMEMPANMAAGRANKMEEHLADWHSAGSQTISVPAGTFSCEHWVNDKNHAEVWTSDKVTPFGMVKEVNASGGTEVLVKVIDDFPDRITGPVKQFDMQQMMQEMQQRRQQKP
jgi:hypothetical protein